MRFGAPLWLFALVVVPLLGACMAWAAYQRRKALGRYGETG